MKKNSVNNDGVTLIELIIALAIISAVIILSANILMVSLKTQNVTVKDYSVQSEMRIATEQTNEIIRYSKAVFAVPKSFVTTVATMDPGWKYLMTSPDNKRVVIMEYDETLDKHIEKVIVKESEDIEYAISFLKDTTANSDTVLKYKIHSYSVDGAGNRLKEKIVYETTIETVNAIQIVDKGTNSSPSIALAFRSDGQTSGKGKNQIAYITIILDVSNSMNQTPSGGGSNTRETTSSRISKVREALVGNGTNTGNGIIQKFSKEENVFISIVPFANTANYPSPHADLNSTGRHPFYEVYDDIKSTSLITTIKEIKADGYNSGQGGTNTGDGLRRAYYLHETFRDRMIQNGTPIKVEDQVHHYTILLVDGETTFETESYNFEDNGFYVDAGSTEKISKKNYDRFNWLTDWVGKPTGAEVLDGNIPYSDYGSAVLNRITYDEGKIKYKSKSWNNWYEYTYNGRYVLYGEKNSGFNRPIITGNGSNSILNSPYVSYVGAKFQDFGIRSYLIGYASGLTNNINYIGDKIGTDNTNRYQYNAANFNLDDIFKNIATDIMADFWIAAGPQINN